MDKIEIKELEIFANHGVFPEENVLGQKFIISATLYTNTRTAGLTDDLTTSIHYGEVSQMITRFGTGTHLQAVRDRCGKSGADASADSSFPSESNTED